MVLPVVPAKFYGGSLPRPWIYEDVKYNSERVDAPSAPCAPLLSWAKDALWSMGGMSPKRKRTQGKIEGSLKKLRALDDDDEQNPNGDTDRDSKASNPGLQDTAVFASEDLPATDDDCEVYSEETSPGVATRARKLDGKEASSLGKAHNGGQSDVGVKPGGFLSSCEGAGPGKAKAAKRAFLKKKRGDEGSDHTRFEPVTYALVESVRRSRRLSGALRGRDPVYSMRA